MPAKIYQLRPEQRPPPRDPKERLQDDLADWIEAQAGRHGAEFDRDWQLRQAFIRAFDAVGRGGFRLRDVIAVADELRGEALDRSKLSSAEAAQLGPGWVKAFRKVWLNYWKGEPPPRQNRAHLVKLSKPEPDGAVQAAALSPADHIPSLRRRRR